MIRTVNQLLIFLFCLILMGCAGLRQPTSVATPTATTAAPIPTASSWQDRSQQLSSIRAWSIHGSTSIQHQNKTDMASLTWIQRDEGYNISLFGPLSLGRVTIQGGPGRVTLTRSNKPPVSASSPEQLMQRELGWQLPISNSFYWVRGIPAPGKYQMRLDSQNRLAQLNQEGWNIQYLGYMKIQQMDLPRTIELSNPRLRIKIVIRNWAVDI